MVTGEDPDGYLNSLNLIKENNYIGFFGLGDFQEKLNLCYYQNSFELDLTNYSTHNQYLEFWIFLRVVWHVMLFMGKT